MADFKMSRNGSGYYDETSYKGINGMAKPGKVWEYLTNNGYKKYVLIIANNGATCSALNLVDEESIGCIEVCEIDYLMRYTDVRLLQYIYNSNLARCLKTISEDDFALILNDIAYNLNILNIAKNDDITHHECFDEMLALFGQMAVEDYCRCRYFFHIFNNNLGAAQKYMDELARISGKEGVDNG